MIRENKLYLIIPCYNEEEVLEETTNRTTKKLKTVKDNCDITISMDADLQDDINVLDKFIEKYNEGCEIVYGVRSSRKTDSFFKRDCAFNRL